MFVTIPHRFCVRKVLWCTWQMSLLWPAIKKLWHSFSIMLYPLDMRRHIVKTIKTAMVNHHFSSFELRDRPSRMCIMDNRKPSTYIASITLLMFIDMTSIRLLGYYTCFHSSLNFPLQCMVHNSVLHVLFRSLTYLSEGNNRDARLLRHNITY